MNNQVRSTMGVIVGITAAYFGVMVIDAFFGTLFPIPQGTDYTDAEQMTSYMQTVPVGVWMFYLVGYALCAFLAGWVANKISESTHYRPSLIAGIGFLVMCIANMYLLWHPTWVWIASVPLYLGAAWLGGRRLS